MKATTPLLWMMVPLLGSFSDMEGGGLAADTTHLNVALPNSRIVIGDIVKLVIGGTKIQEEIEWLRLTLF